MSTYRVTIGSQTMEVSEGTTYEQLAKQSLTNAAEEISGDIVLVKVNDKLQELPKTVKEDCTVNFVTTAEPEGANSYERSMLLLINKAIYDVVPLEKIHKVTVRFSLRHGLYIEPAGDFAVDEVFVSRVKSRMQELVEEDLPIEKINVHVDEAIRFFHRVKMYDKERLFRYRRSSHVNLYSLAGFKDYHYGYMVPSTGYLKYFDILPYQEGLALILPRMQMPRTVDPFDRQDKLFHVMQDSYRWGEQMDLETVGAVNDMISAGHLQDLILIAEARQEKQIADIAAQIAERPNTKFVMIAGPSSSGKTSFSHRLSIQLRARGLTPHPIAVDDYFVDREHTPRDEKGEYDFETIHCVDIEQFNNDMTDLREGKTVKMPTFDFIQGRRVYQKGNILHLGPNDILVIEGIHCLNDELSYSLPPESKFRIYISALTQLNIDEHNRIPTTDGRLIRRMVRDARTRGASARDTIARWPSVRRGEEKNIFPYQESADIMFNSALIYEFSVLKSYVEPLLYGIPQDAPEYQEAKRLLKFFDYILPVDSTAVPQNSLLKEFIGGSCFKV